MPQFVHESRQSLFQIPINEIQFEIDQTVNIFAKIEFQFGAESLLSHWLIVPRAPYSTYRSESTCKYFYFLTNSISQVGKFWIYGTKNDHVFNRDYKMSKLRISVSISTVGLAIYGVYRLLTRLNKH